jgi:hypothetical protein
VETRFSVAGGGAVETDRARFEICCGFRLSVEPDLDAELTGELKWKEYMALKNKIVKGRD